MKLFIWEYNFLSFQCLCQWCVQIFVQTETWEAPSQHQETLFCCEGGKTLAQVCQGGCGVYLLRNTQKSSRHGPGQPALGLPGQAGGLDHTNFRGPFQPQPSSDSVTQMLPFII